MHSRTIPAAKAILALICALTAACLTFTPAAYAEITLSDSTAAIDAPDAESTGQTAAATPGEPQALFNEETPASSDTPALDQAQALGGLPSSYDARTQGLTTYVRQQEPWQTCWAISCLEAMETNLIKQGLVTQDDIALSARHLVWFASRPLLDATSPQNGEGQHASSALTSIYQDNAPFSLGGHIYEVAQAIASGAGPVSEGAYPYQNNEEWPTTDENGTPLFYSTAGTWGLDDSYRFAHDWQLREMQVLPNPAHYDTSSLSSYAFDDTALANVKQAILDYGSVAASYNSASKYYDATTNAYFTNASKSIDHGIQIVGWDDSISADIFTTGMGGSKPEGNGAWIVKNSWGAQGQGFPNESDWGDNGYFYLSYYDRSAQYFATFNMMANSDDDATTITNQHDYLGWSSNTSSRVASNTQMKAANIFTANQNQELTAVSANTYAPGSKVTVSVYRLDGQTPDGQTAIDPTAGVLLEEKTMTFEYGGYHRIQLDRTHLMLEGERFAVVEEIIEPSAAGDVWVASIEAGTSEAARSAWGTTHSDTVVCNPGETSVFVDLKDEANPLWHDGASFDASLSALSKYNNPYGNANIKAFSNPSTTSTRLAATQSFEQASVDSGSTATAHFTLSNTTSDPTGPATIIYKLPQGARNVTASDGGTVSKDGTTITWHIATLEGDVSLALSCSFVIDNNESADQTRTGTLSFGTDTEASLGKTSTSTENIVVLAKQEPVDPQPDNATDDTKTDADSHSSSSDGDLSDDHAQHANSTNTETSSTASEPAQQSPGISIDDQPIPSTKAIAAPATARTSAQPTQTARTSDESNAFALAVCVLAGAGAAIAGLSFYKRRKGQS